MKRFKNLQENISVKESLDGNLYRMLTYKGNQYGEPYFTGEDLGWVKEILWDECTRTYNFLIITVDECRLWLVINEKVAKYFNPNELGQDAPLYFCIYQMRKCKKDRVPYNIYELISYPELLDGYEKPETFLKE